MKHVHPALKDVSGPVFIRGSAHCLVLHHAIVSHVTSDALTYFLVDTSVQVFVEKSVLENFAKSVA